MRLAERVAVSGRFQRSIRIDTDLGDASALEGFICPPSSALVLETMARHVEETGHGAFTWTGPYGSGKSSLAVALSALLNGNVEMRLDAAASVGEATAKTIWNALPPRTEGWQVVPIVGRRDRPEQSVGEAIVQRGIVPGRKRRRVWKEQHVLDALRDAACRDPDCTGGLIVIIDEMGKFLEGAARDGSDVYFFQQLAEIASRSNRRLLVIGILHQAFEEYAYRLSREARDEWAKIQGRFVDLSVNTAVEEQIGLLGRAIESDRHPIEPSSLSQELAQLTTRGTSGDLPRLFEDCWPLHPVVACLLGPISRRRFGQNQRSIFGFLNSTEPSGFQDFLRRAWDGELYPPHLLWDYLRLNLEPSIMASPDGHRWAMAVDALERCQAMGGGEFHLRLLATIALIDLFKERSGLTPTQRVLSCSLPSEDSMNIKDTLAQLESWSLVIYRKLSDSYSVFEGSDFDINEAVERALGPMPDVDISRLNDLADLQPIVAKRHYHETGSMRWFDVAMAPLADVAVDFDSYSPKHGAIGTFLLLVPTQGESPETIQANALKVLEQERNWDLVIGTPGERWNIASLARELLAIEEVRDQSPELQGDRVARREIEIRVSTLRGYIESELSQAFNSALWQASGVNGRRLTYAQLNGLASDLAERRFSASPRVQNELLNRVKPSSNAIAAQNILVRRMVLNEEQERLGIEGFPAEGGLFDSLLGNSGLYRTTQDGWRFVGPVAGESDPCRLGPVWEAAEELLRSNGHRTVSVAEIGDLWREPPFGIKEGLLPVLAAAFILSHGREVAFYRHGIFQARVTDVDLDYLARDPRDVQLRWMDLSEKSRAILSDMAGIVRALDSENALTHLEPIDVAKGLVSIHDRLPHWVGRTQNLSANAKRVRQLFKQASDPNRLIFDDIPQLLSEASDAKQGEEPRSVASHVLEGLTELQQAYPSMLQRLQDILLAELQVPNASPPSLAELRARADNVRGLGGDHRMEAFVLRLAQFSGSHEDMEGLASMAANKPLPGWVDADIERATVELADMAQRFMRVESYAHVKGRTNRRHAMAVTVGIGGRPTTVQDEFAVTASERSEVDELLSRMTEVLRDSEQKKRNVILASLAELTARYLAEADGTAPRSKNGTKRGAS